MRLRHFSAVATLAALSCVIFAACLQSPVATDASPSRSVERENEPSGAEPIGEALQPMGHVPLEYSSKDFPFSVSVKDDGEGPGGGWQRSITSLPFVVVLAMRESYVWECPIEI